MSDKEQTSWEDDEWEPELAKVSDEEHVKRLEKRLEEQKLVEDADLEFAEDLFSTSKKQNDSLALVQPIITIKNHNESRLKEKLIKEKLIKEKLKKEKLIREKEKERNKRSKELYGEAEVDEYEEMYGHIEDRYY